MQTAGWNLLAHSCSSLPTTTGSACILYPTGVVGAVLRTALIMTNLVSKSASSPKTFETHPGLNKAAKLTDYFKYESKTIFKS